MEETKNKKSGYITLFEAAKLCSYSEPYLRLRARQGKLKSIKLGKKWMTRAVWIDEYAACVRQWNEKTAGKKNVPAAVAAAAETFAPPANLPAEPMEKPMVVLIEEREEKPVIAKPVPKRLKTVSGAGQLLPLREPGGDRVNLEWIGAMLSGAAAALALFLAMGWGWLPDIAKIDSLQFSQAGAGQAFLAANSIPEQAIYEEPAAPAQDIVAPAATPSVSGNPLEKLVEWLARFFDGGE